MASLSPWRLLTALRGPWSMLDAVTGAEHHRVLDRVFSLVTHADRFFPQGWGDPGVIEAFARDLQLMKAAAQAGELFVDPPRDLQLSPPKARRRQGVVLQDGSFESPLAASGLLPASSERARFRLVTPAEPGGLEGRPVVVLLPGTGEHGYSRRQACMSVPLAARGVASLILEGPFYGKRRPPGQKGSKLGRVSDLPVLGRATIEEAQALLGWLRAERGAGALAVGGGSMGGLHAAMTASLTPLPLGVVSWLGPPSAAPVFTEGVLADACEWSRLCSQTDDVAPSLDRVVASELFDRCQAQAQEDSLERAKAAMARLLGITDITHFPTPQRPDATVFAVAEYDEYIPPPVADHSWPLLQERWPGIEVRRVPLAHVSGIIFGTDGFNKSVEEVLERVSS